MSRLPVILICLCLLACTGKRLYAQQQELPVFKLISHPFMPAISSQYFYFTRDGLIWFSTSRGLTSFDGSEIIYYSGQEQVSDFRLNSINAIAEDKAGNLYIAAADRLCFFNRQSKSFLMLRYRPASPEGDLSFFVNSIFIDADGLVYIGSLYRGFFVYNPINRMMQHVNLQADKPDNWDNRWQNSVGSFTAHKDDSKLWIGAWNGIYLFDKKSKQLTRNFTVINPRINKHLDYPKDQLDVQYMDMADDSTIWFNSYNGGFCRYDIPGGSVHSYLQGYQDQQKNWMAYTIKGVGKISGGKYFLGVYDPHPAVFDVNTQQVYFLPMYASSPYFDRVRYVSNDREGNIWVLNSGQLYAAIPDAYRLKRIAVQELPPADRRYNEIYDILYDDSLQQYLLCGRTTDGIRVLDKNFKEKEIIPAPRMSNYFLNDMTDASHITKDSSGNYWTTGLITSIMQPGRTGRGFRPVQEIYPSLAWLQKKQWSDILTASDGDIYLGQFSNGLLYRINPATQHTDTIHLPKRGPAENGYEINSYFIHYDRKHEWIYFSDRTTLARYDTRTKEITAVPAAQMKPPGTKLYDFMKFVLDDQQRIWILSEVYGLRLIDPVTLTCIDSIAFGTRGLLKDICTDIRYVSGNKLMLKTGASIILYDYEKKRSVVFDKGNGYSYQQPKTILYSNGYLFVSQTGELEYYQAAQFDSFRYHLSAGLNTVTVDTTIVYTSHPGRPAEPITLPWHKNNLGFSFSAQEYFFPERIEYAYQLEGVDKEWQHTHSLTRRVNYSRLKPGRYTFKIMAQFEGGTWQAAPAEYLIYIKPAFWQTNFFKTAAAIFLTGLLFFLFRYRLKTIRKNEQQTLEHERELLELEAKALRAQMNPHFIFNSLNSIKSLINKGENESAARYLTTFSKLIRTLFQNSDKREVSLHEELETCKLYTQLERMRFGKNVTFSFEIDPQVDVKDIKVPALIIQPFIENAIWHGLVPLRGEGLLRVIVQQKGQATECIVDDNGIGREMSAKFKKEYEGAHESKGIQLTSARITLDKKLNGREDHIIIIDKKDDTGKPAGTKVTLTFYQNRQ